MKKEIKPEADSARTLDADLEDAMPISPPVPSANKQAGEGRAVPPTRASLIRPNDVTEVQYKEHHTRLIADNQIKAETRASAPPVGMRDERSPRWITKSYWFPAYWVMCAFLTAPIGIDLFEPHPLLGMMLTTTFVASCFYGIGLMVDSEKSK